MDTKSHQFISYSAKGLSTEESVVRAQSWYKHIDERRSIRDYSDRPVPKEVIENIILGASSAPSGAHKQPWTFCVVSDPKVKKEIRIKAEKEEYDSYHGRMSDEWLEDLKAFGTDWNKPFLETAPYLIIVFKQIHAEDKSNHYYVNESVGIATGFLINGIHEAGLVTLTHTPSPMRFLNEILNRPSYEKPFILLPVGYPAEEVQVPDLKRKSLDECSSWFE